MKCSLGLKTKDCQHRQCELIFKEVSETAQAYPANANYISGDKSCYKQVLGQYAGCYKQGIKYIAPQGSNSAKIPNLKNWGLCAEKCKSLGKTLCSFWTWASTSCTNCIPNTCYLINEPNRIEPKQVVDLAGHISGTRSCVDINYVEKDKQKVQPVQGGGGKDFPVGSCRTTGGEAPKCPGQEVPGYRYTLTW